MMRSDAVGEGPGLRGADAQRLLLAVDAHRSPQRGARQPHPRARPQPQRTPAGETALHIAAFWNVVPVVKRLLAHPNVNVNVMASKGATPLHVACHRGHSAVIILLLRHPSTAVNVGWTVSCFTPLFLAVKQVRIASPISTGHYRTQRSLMALPGCAAGKRGRGRDTSK